jgi:protein arginine N-methyltransferase 1
LTAAIETSRRPEDKVPEYSLFHYAQMISSRKRMESFTEALRRNVKAGTVVCDLGTGLGLFAILAAQMGARRVYAIEPNDVIETAAEVARASGCADRIEFIQGFSTDVSLPEPVDLIVSDLRATLPFHGGHIPALVDARERFLKPGGCLIPDSDSLWLSVVRCRKLYRRLFEPWVEVPGVNLAVVRDRLLLQPGRCRATVDQLLPERVNWGTLDYRTITSPDHTGTAAWRIEEPATGFGLCLWFDSDLAPGVALSNAPDVPPLPYGHLFLPWTEPLDLEPGQWITVSLDARLEDRGYVFESTVTLRQEGPVGPVVKQLTQTAA